MILRYFCSIVRFNYLFKLKINFSNSREMVYVLMFYANICILLYSHTDADMREKYNEHKDFANEQKCVLVDLSSFCVKSKKVYD